MNQPTMDELQAAWTGAIHCEGIPGASSEAMATLKRLRVLKTTWVGKDECGLRFALDRYLDSCQQQPPSTGGDSR